MNILMIIIILIQSVVGFGRAGWVNNVNRIKDREFLKNLIGQIREYAGENNIRNSRRYRRSRYALYHE